MDALIRPPRCPSGKFCYQCSFLFPVCRFWDAAVYFYYWQLSHRTLLNRIATHIPACKLCPILQLITIPRTGPLTLNASCRPLPLNCSGARPRLNPLDLAVARPTTPAPFSAKFTHTLPSPALNSAQNSPSCQDNYFGSPRTSTSTSSPRRSGTLLTPPLTPSSSFNSASTVATDSEFGSDPDVVPGTPPDGGSPLTWAKLNIHRKSSIDFLNGENTVAAFGSGIANGHAGDATEEIAALVKRVDLTPKLEKKFAFGELSEQDVRKVSEHEWEKEDFEKNATRFLLVGAWLF